MGLAVMSVLTQNRSDDYRSLDPDEFASLDLIFRWVHLRATFFPPRLERQSLTSFYISVITIAA